MSSKSDIVIFGAGGHAKVIADIVKQDNQYNIITFIDDQKQNLKIWDIPIISESVFFAKPNTLMGIVAIGDNFIREKVAIKIHNLLPNFIFIKAIHPTAYVALDSTIDDGTVVMAHATINPSTKIGSHCIINTNSSIDHDCIVENYASIAPNACLGGNCEVGKGSAVSIGATLSHKIKIGENTVIGAGAVVTRSVSSNIVAYGVPAKNIRSRKLGEKYL